MSSVQTYLTQKTASFLSKKLNTEITVGGIDICWFLDIVVEDVLVKDLKGNDIINAKKIILDIKDLSLRKNFLIIDKLHLKDASLNLCIYEGEENMNFQFISDYFASSDTTEKEKAAWKINVECVKFSDVSFFYRDFNKERLPYGIDFNYLNINNLNGDIDNISIKGDTIDAFVKHLSCNDHSGFEIKKLTGNTSVSGTFLDIKNLKLQTKDSDISGALLFTYNSYSDYNQFVDKVVLDVILDKSLIALNDISYFVPDMEGMDNKLDINGQVKGKISNLRGRSFEIKTGKNTFYKGDFSISGLPDIESTFINFNAKNFSTAIEDIKNFKLPVNAKFELPESLIKLGYVNFRGNFTGFINDFVAYGLFTTSIGTLKTDISLKTNQNNLYVYNGNIELSAFDMGKMFDNSKNLGKVTLNFKLNGKGFDFENVDMELNGIISSIELMKYDYKNITIAGNLNNKTFTGFIDIKEKNVELDFEGVVDLRKDLPVFDFSSNIKYVKLNKLNLTPPDKDRELSAFMKCRFKGKTLEDISGIFLLNNVVFKENDKSIRMKNLQINNVSEADNYKNIVLNSEIFDAFIDGHFIYADLPASFTGFINNYLPSYSQDSLIFKDTANFTAIKYDIKFKQTNELLQFFVPELSVAEDFNLYGRFDYEQDIFTVDGGTKKIKFGNTYLSDWVIKAYSDNRIFSVNTSANKLVVSDGFELDNFKLNSQSKNDSILFDLDWKNKVVNARNSGEIKGFASFEKAPLIELKFLKGNVFINDSLWVVDAGNTIFIDSNFIEINNLTFKHNLQTFAISGNISDNSDHQLLLGFNDFDISDFNPLLKKQGIDLQGILSGRISLFDLYKTPNLTSDIIIKNLTVNGDKLGNLVLKSQWEGTEERLKINSEIVWVGAVGEKTPFKLDGYYYPKDEVNNFDLNFHLQNFSLKLLEKFFLAFSSDFRGMAYGELTLKGTPKKPLLNGILDLKRASLKVDYLNTTLGFSDIIKIENNLIVFDSLVLNDKYNDNTGLLDGVIYHDNFKDFRLDLNFKMNNLLCLNTDASQNEMFYGTAFASGTTRIHGPVDNLIMDVYAKTERNTRFYLPLTSTGEVSEHSFIKFISTDTSIIKDITPLVVDLNGIQLNFDLEVTSDAEAQIIFDSKIGDIIKARGNGNLKMEINTLGDFNMFGDYIIDDGDYLFTLQNFINKRFRIQKGSQISWSGDPYEAIADVNAIYSLRTPLYDLVFFADSSEEYKKRMPVNCLLGMKGSLFNPDITFNLELPGADEKTKNLVNTIINSEAESNRQMFALLALNRFLPPAELNEFSNVGIGTGIEATSTEMLSNQLSNWLSQISKDFDIGVNYRAGNELSSDEVEVALSTQILNDRVSIDGSVGTGGNKQNASQIVGDVNVELKLTDDGKLRMKFYNKSNSVDMLKINAPYTQGIGLFYRKEFDSFRYLLRKR